MQLMKMSLRGLAHAPESPEVQDIDVKILSLQGTKALSSETIWSNRLETEAQ